MGFTKILALLILLALCVAVGILLPAHWQIQRIEPDLPSATEFRSLGEASDRPIRVSYLHSAEQPRGGRLLGHGAFLAEWADGRMFMIDASMDEKAAKDFGALMRLIGDAGQDLFHGSVSKLLGSALNRVEGVGLTHLHIDHSQGLTDFCGSRSTASPARVYQTPWQAEEVNLHTSEGAEIVRSSCLQPTLASREGMFLLPDFPGLGMVALGGHTPGSTLFAIAGPDRIWLIAGDTTNIKSHIPEDRPKALTYSYLMVPENTARTSQLRSWLAALDAEQDFRVLVSHDVEDIRSSGMPEFRGPR